MKRVAALFDNFGPYHRARLRAAASGCELLAVEVARRSGEYAWDRQEKRKAGNRGQGAKGGEFKMECLFDGTSEGVTSNAMKARVGAVLGEFQPDVVVVPGWASRAALAALRWAQEHRVPAVVMSESTAWDESRSAWKESVKRQVVAGFSAALVGGAPHADYMAQLGMPREHTFLGYDAVDNDYFAAGAAKSREQRAESRNRHGLPEKYFLASARFVEKKNLPRLLEAYARYRALCSDHGPRTTDHVTKSAGTSPRPSPQSGEGVVPWSLVLLGDGPLRETLNSQLSTLNLHGHVQMPGFKQYPDLPAYYGCASAFIHASTTEQWGLVVNEAMASGLPVLVSNRCGCAPDLVQDGVNGFTFDPFNVEEMAKVILRVWSMEEGTHGMALDTSPNPVTHSRPLVRPDGPSTARIPPAASQAAGVPDRGGEGSANGSGLRPVTTLAEMGYASRKIIADWGPERFASGLNQAVDKALEVGPIKPTLLQRAILAALQRR
jgi:1,2-diacylglycerol 3-alpha-glucosyltransferase